jgi:hypothetical protein
MYTRIKRLLAASVLVCAAALTPNAFPGREKVQQPSLVTLRSPEGALDTFGAASYISSADDDRTLYVLNGLTGDVESYSSEADGPYRAAGKAPAAVRGPRGLSAKADKNLTVTIFDAAGKRVASFPTLKANSMAFLSNGNLVVSSPQGEHFLHVYSPTGQLLKSFGSVGAIDMSSSAQNLFLHQGKVLVDAADNIYYVYRFAPMIQKFSADGALLAEAPMEGEAITIQWEVALRYFSNRDPERLGGIDITNSAAIDRKTGNLFVALNGSDRGGVVYEYSPRVEKLREYAFRAGGKNLTAVKDIAVTGSKIHVLTTERQVLRFDRSRVGSATRGGSVSAARPARAPFIVKASWKAATAAAMAQTSCPPNQEWSSCTFTCPGPACSGSTPTPTSSTGTTRDCKAALSSGLIQGYTVVSANCTQFPAGTQMHMRGGCTASVTICRNGTNTTHTSTQDCPAPSCETSSNSCPHISPTLIGWCTDWDYGACVCAGYIEKSPVIIDVLGNGFSLTDAAGGVNFDLDASGTAERLSWTAADSDDAFLVLDRDGDGLIKYGMELFGNGTQQAPSNSPNGFLALAEFDRAANGGNSDGSIDASDTVYSSLRLWQDANHNGVSEAAELRTLPSLNVESISLDHRESKRRDRYGNTFRYRAKVYGTKRSDLGRWAYDVFLVAGN